MGKCENREIGFESAYGRSRGILTETAERPGTPSLSRNAVFGDEARLIDEAEGKR